MCSKPGFKWGLHNKGHDRPLAKPIVWYFEHHAMWQVHLTLGATWLIWKHTEYARQIQLFILNIMKVCNWKDPVHFVIAELYTKSSNSNTSSTITDHWSQTCFCITTIKTKISKKNPWSLASYYCYFLSYHTLCDFILYLWRTYWV